MPLHGRRQLKNNIAIHDQLQLPIVLNQFASPEMNKVDPVRSGLRVRAGTVLDSFSAFLHFVKNETLVCVQVKDSLSA